MSKIKIRQEHKEKSEKCFGRGILGEDKKSGVSMANKYADNEQFHRLSK